MNMFWFHIIAREENNKKDLSFEVLRYDPCKQIIQETII